jgi:hypothetical protein
MEASDFIPHDWREWRRLQALHLKQQGWYQRDIAEALGASEESVSRWLARARHGGLEALLAHPAPGRPAKLSDTQKRLIPEFLWHGPEAYGFRGQVWTPPASPESSLHEESHLAVGRLRHKPHLIQAFFAQAGLNIEKT